VRVKAGDIQISDQIEVLNPDHVICTVSKGGRFFRGADHHGRSRLRPLRAHQAGGSADRHDSRSTPCNSPIRKVNCELHRAIGPHLECELVVVAH